MWWPRCGLGQSSKSYPITLKLHAQEYVLSILIPMKHIDDLYPLKLYDILLLKRDAMLLCYILITLLSYISALPCSTLDFDSLP